jgi:hypothetical protein
MDESNEASMHDFIIHLYKFLQCVSKATSFNNTLFGEYTSNEVNSAIQTIQKGHHLGMMTVKQNNYINYLIKTKGLNKEVVTSVFSALKTSVEGIQTFIKERIFNEIDKLAESKITLDRSLSTIIGDFHPRTFYFGLMVLQYLNGIGKIKGDSTSKDITSLFFYFLYTNKCGVYKNFINLIQDKLQDSIHKSVRYRMFYALLAIVQLKDCVDFPHSVFNKESSASKEYYITNINVVKRFINKYIYPELTDAQKNTFYSQADFYIYKSLIES